MLTMAQIRKHFPKPGYPSDPSSGSYCVGGAFCMAIGAFAASRFPDQLELASALALTNPRLSANDANAYAMRIIGANDRGCLEEAWRHLDEALAVATVPQVLDEELVSA